MCRNAMEERRAIVQAADDWLRAAGEGEGDRSPADLGKRG